MSQPSQPFTIRLLAHLEGQKRAVSRLQFSPDGSMLVSVGWKTCIWQDDRKGNWSLHHTSTGSPLSIGSDNTLLMLITGHNEQDCIERQDHNGISLETIACGHLPRHFCYGYSPDHRWFLTFDDTGWLSFWDAQTLLLTKRCLLVSEPLRRGSIDRLQFTPNKQFLFFQCNELVHRCQFNTHVPEVVPEGDLLQRPRHILTTEDFKISPCGDYIAVANSSAPAVELYHSTSFHLIASFPAGERPFLLAFSPDGHSLACVDDECRVYIWHVYTQQLLATFISHQGPYTEQASSVASLAWSPRGDILAIAGSLYETGDFSIKLWSIEESLS